MSTVRISVQFEKDEPEFPFFKISEFVKDFDITREDNERLTVEYQVYAEDVDYVETVFDQHPGTVIYRHV